MSAEQADNKGDDLDRDAADAPGEIAPDVWGEKNGAREVRRGVHGGLNYADTQETDYSTQASASDWAAPCFAIVVWMSHASGSMSVPRL